MSKSPASLRLFVAVSAVVMFFSSVSISAQDFSERVTAELAPGRTKAVRNKPAAPSVAPSVIQTPDVVSSGSYLFSTNTTGAFTNMTGSTQLVAPGSDDVSSVATAITFDFYFMGVRYTQFSASSNGYIELGASAVSTTQYVLGTAATPLITAMGSDLIVSATGKVHYKVTGAAPNRVLTIEFLNMTVIYDGVGTSTDCTSEVRLHETTGVIEFVYGNMRRNSSTGFMGGNDPQYIGFSTNSTAGTSGSVDTADGASFAGAPVANQFTLNTTIANLNSPTDGSRKSYLFTPPLPTAPTNLTFTGVGTSGMTLNWTDSPDEDLYAIYRSTDGVNYTFLNTAAENSTSFAVTGLSPSTTYFWQVNAISEGALNATPLAGAQATAAPGNVTCNGAGGNWSAAGTWSPGVPTNTDAVTIGPGCTIIVDVTTATAFSVTVQSGGVLQYINTPASTLTVATDVTINSGGTVSAGAGTLTTHVLSIGGNLTNNGTLDLFTTAGVGLTFTGAANNTFGGSGATTDIRTLTINKGTSNANILELNPSVFTVQGTVADGTPMAFLTLTNGTLKVSGTFTATGRVFTLASYIIAANAGFWLNNPNFTVSGQNGSPTANGLLRISQGTFNIGTLTGNSMGFGTGSTVIVEGGAVNSTGRFGVAAAGNTFNYTQTAGTITVNTIGNGSATLGSFDLGTSLSSTINVSGGTIIAQLAASAIDYRDQAGSGIIGFTGGTLQLGNAGSGAAKAFNLRGVLPNLLITNTSANHSATMNAAPVNYNNISLNITISAGTTFNAGNVTFLFNGTVFTNNGIFTHNGASSNFVVFNPSAPITYTGSGTVTSPMSNLAIQSDQGFTISPASPNIVVGALRLFDGNVINANKITVGTGGATSATVQIGNTTTPSPAGTFDVPLTFNLGTGGEILSYLRTGASRNTGGEVNSTRSVTTFTFDDNDPTHTLTLAGGDLTVTGVTALTNGRLITGANNFIIGGAGSVTRTTGYIDGNLHKTYTAAASKLFEVGTPGGYAPVNISATAGTFPADFLVGSHAGVMAGIDPRLTLTRYWTLTPTGITQADITFTYLDTDIPATADETQFNFVRRSGTTVTEFVPTTSNTATDVFALAGVTSFSDWTLGKAASPTSTGVTISGRVLTADGQGVPNASVRLTGMNGQARTYVTSPFGYYTFDSVLVGQDYIVTVAGKGHEFAPRLITLTEAVPDLDFVASP